jgi:hypothetical protein
MTKKNCHIQHSTSGLNREPTESWPLLAIKNEANGGSGSTNERGPSLVGLLGSSSQYTRFLPCPCCSSRPAVHYFNSVVPIAQQVGTQSCRVAFLIVCSLFIRRLASNKAAEYKVQMMY